MILLLQALAEDGLSGSSRICKILHRFISFTSHSTDNWMVHSLFSLAFCDAVRQYQIMAGKWNQSTSNISICRFYMILCYVFVILCPSSRVTKKSSLPFNLPAVLFNALNILGSVSLACHSGKACLKRHGMLFGSAITAPGGTELHLSQKWLSDWRPLRTSVCRTPAWRAEPGALSRIWGVHLSIPTPLTLKSPAGSPCQVDVSMAWAPLKCCL